MKVLCFDLDDTLYKEIDYLKSAYRQIAAYAVQMCASTIDESHSLDKAYSKMMEAYQNGQNAFETLNSYLGLEIPLRDLLLMYREHIPQISLEDDVRYTLDYLKEEGVLMGILSDGREQTQWNKVRALGLTEWVDESCIIINSVPEYFKPSPSGYKRLETAIRNLTTEKELSFIYLADNLNKDFIYPKQHGWHTICLKDDGRNIHKQNFKSTPIGALPDCVINSIRELLTIVAIT